MRTTEEYAAMIPAAPPFDLVGYLREKGKMQTEVISYKWLGRDDADSWIGLRRLPERFAAQCGNKIGPAMVQCMQRALFGGISAARKRSGLPRRGLHGIQRRADR